MTNWKQLCHDLAAVVVQPPYKGMAGLSEVLDRIIAADKAAASGITLPPCRHCTHDYDDHDFATAPPADPYTCACSQCPDGWCHLKPVQDLYAWLGEQVKSCNEQSRGLSAVAFAQGAQAEAFVQVREQLRSKFAWLPFEPEIDNR